MQEFSQENSLILADFSENFCLPNTASTASTSSIVTNLDGHNLQGSTILFAFLSENKGIKGVISHFLK
jgi:hypothetical protein